MNRRKTLEDAARGFGISPEQLEEIENKARAELAGRNKAGKDETEAALHVAMNLLKEGGTISPADSTISVDEMSTDQFGNLLAATMSVLDEESQREAAKSTARKIARWREDDLNPFSLREEILLNLKSMIKGFNYRKNRE